MVQRKNIAAIVNPRAAGGKAAKLWPEISQGLQRHFGPVTTRFTESTGGGIPLTRELLRQGSELIIAVGGDGTINEVANGFLALDEPVKRDACLGILPLGTGGDFQRTLGISSDPREAMDVLVTGAPCGLTWGRRLSRALTARHKKGISSISRVSAWAAKSLPAPKIF